MLRTSLRSVSGPSSRHVRLSCLARPGAPSLRQFHRISALRTDSVDTKLEINSFDASTETSVPLPPRDQIPVTKDVASDKPHKRQPPEEQRQLTASVWAGMRPRQKFNYKRRHPLLYKKFKMEVLNKDIAPSQAAQSEGPPSEATPSEEAPSEAARVEAEKIKTLQQKVIEADMEAKREKKAKIKAQMLKKKEKESQPGAEIPTDGPSDTPAFSEPKESTLNLKSTSNVVAESQNEPEEKMKEKGILHFIEDHITSKDRGSLSSKDQSLFMKELPVSVPTVPRVAFGLDRVLFNPGVYQLRDPRTLVYNFDPYLDQIMPVTEFDFNTLRPYITSSQDVTACEMTEKHKKKYYGSSSSMTSVLAHFHYLLSAWRPVDISKISRGFDDPHRTFTRLLRAPAAMFLRYKEKEDIYAIDADKEYDYSSILMNLGKSMEKQLTMPKDQFERYRRSDPNKITAEEEAATPESYHYSTVGKFLMRSQLDAYDPRLPGTGMFDLKTRAVVSIRMDASDHERGMGYEIRRRHGKYESYEREYFDMIRSAFLKYSLQVRVGRMDGIFVAYHNIERIFGFQYIPLDEMDQALHGTGNTALGNKEFELSLGLWEKVLDKATQKYPKKSLRFHFETRQGTVPHMAIVAQPVTDEEIEAIQTKNKAHIDAIQDRLLNPEEFIDRTPEAAVEGSVDEFADEEVEDESFYPEEEPAEAEAEAEAGESIDREFRHKDGQLAEAKAEAVNLQNDPSTKSLADTLFPEEEGEEISEAEKSEYHPSIEPEQTPEPIDPTKTVPKRNPFVEDKVDQDVFGMMLVVHNKVNGEAVQRPTRFNMSDRWEVEYELNELDLEESNETLRTCKRRRDVALTKNVMDHDATYFRNLQNATNRGRAWRKRMDEKDRERGILVYKDSSDM
ncbi:hypothetical protein N7465_003850 [Penicillium sp. CMV-2018d]|nr:hypothetical protein N7465_003850 [Penicillium sp. CMV-2018d]